MRFANADPRAFIGFAGPSNFVFSVTKNCNHSYPPWTPCISVLTPALTFADRALGLRVCKSWGFFALSFRHPALSFLTSEEVARV